MEFQLIASISERLGLIPALIVDASPRRANLSQGAGKLKSAERMCRDNRKASESVEDCYTTEIMRENIFHYAPGIVNTRAKVAAERAIRALLADFIEGALKIDPLERLMPADAMNHSFLTVQC
jgi:hypothetical protein